MSFTSCHVIFITDWWLQTWKSSTLLFLIIVTKQKKAKSSHQTRHVKWCVLSPYWCAVFFSYYLLFNAKGSRFCCFVCSNYIMEQTGPLMTISDGRFVHSRSSLGGKFSFEGYISKDNYCAFSRWRCEPRQTQFKDCKLQFPSCNKGIDSYTAACNTDSFKAFSLPATYVHI